MNAYRLAAIAALSLAVAACGKSSTAPDPTEGAAAASTANATPEASGEAQTAKLGKGAGTVTAIDAASGTITLDHGPIPELGWPAMKMTFNAAPGVTGATAVGDRVEFDVRLTGMDGEVTALRKQ